MGKAQRTRPPWSKRRAKPRRVVASSDGIARSRAARRSVSFADQELINTRYKFLSTSLDQAGTAPRSPLDGAGRSRWPQGCCSARRGDPVSASVLIVDDEKSFRVIAEEALSREGYRLLTAATAARGAELWRQEHPDVVVLDRNLPDADGVELLKILLRESEEQGVGALFIMATAYGDVENAVQALRLGAEDYLTKPIQLADLIIKIRKALEARRLRNRVRALQRGHGREAATFATRSPAMEQVFEQARRVAQSPGTPVLLQGESGAGKEVLARFIHGCTEGRCEDAFIEVNCAALTAGLLESELFGHERGAFTDAKESKRGLFELADGGTLLLDEIGDLGLHLQAKLLRAIETKRFRRVGGSSDLSADVRVIAATNRNLLEEVSAGRFRLDLYHRLGVFPMTVPPLRERREDVIALAGFLLDSIARRLARPVPQLSEAAQATLFAYDFPGNVRELRNALERALIISTGSALEPADLGLDTVRRPAAGGPQSEWPLDIQLGKSGLPPTLAELEKLYLERMLRYTKGNRKQAARLMAVSYPTIIRKISDYRILVPE
jgi:two-component system response regulator AtoC